MASMRQEAEEKYKKLVRITGMLAKFQTSFIPDTSLDHMLQQPGQFGNRTM
jgi:hypothetical protein